MEDKPRLGRIRYINVLPIYHAIDRGYVSNGFNMISGTPAELNARFHQGDLDVSAISSLEYGRHFKEYMLLPDLSISTKGDVGSVLLFSRLPFHRLTGRDVLLSEGSATSAALVKIVLTERYGARPLYRLGPVTDRFCDGCCGMLAIGDEALRLKATGAYPFFLDLGRAWHELTALPFVFGVWAVRRSFFDQRPSEVYYLHQTLLEAKKLGLRKMEDICSQAAEVVNMSSEQVKNYFQLLNYDLDDGQQEGLEAFYSYLYRFGELPELPELRFI
jgi:chorismate dehydratase